MYDVIRTNTEIGVDYCKLKASLMTVPAAAVQPQQHQALPPVLPSEIVAHPPQMPLLTLPLPPYVETQHV